MFLATHPHSSGLPHGRPPDETIFVSITTYTVVTARHASNNGTSPHGAGVSGRLCAHTGAGAARQNHDTWYECY